MTSLSFTTNIMDILTSKSLVPSFFIGCALTTFFKKSFRFERYSRAILQDIASLLIVLFPWDGYLSSYLVTALRIALVLVALKRNAHLYDEKVKTVVLSAAVVLLIERNIDVNYALLAQIFACTQLVRNPEWVKEKMREPRIVCGPLFGMMCLGNFLEAPSYVRSLPVITVLLASLIFRPDNDETIKYLAPKVPSFSTRRMIHGILMLTSFILLILLPKLENAAHPYERLLQFGLTCGSIGVLNIFLYILYKTTQSGIKLV